MGHLPYSAVAVFFCCTRQWAWWKSTFSQHFLLLAFVSIIVVHYHDILICKTVYLSHPKIYTIQLSCKNSSVSWIESHLVCPKANLSLCCHLVWSQNLLSGVQSNPFTGITALLNSQMVATFALAFLTACKCPRCLLLKFQWEFLWEESRACDPQKVTLPLLPMGNPALGSVLS